LFRHIKKINLRGKCILNRFKKCIFSVLWLLSGGRLHASENAFLSAFNIETHVWVSQKDTNSPNVADRKCSVIQIVAV